MNEHLNRAHQNTYDAIFRHPVARNLAWRDVHSLLGVLGEVAEESNGKLKVTRHGHTLVLPATTTKTDADIDDLMAIRHFLKRCGTSEQAAPVAGPHLLVVIDHRQARVYQTELHGAVPLQITPYDPGGFGRHLHNVEDHADGQRKPERKSFYEAVANSLRGAEKVLIFGSGTGASSAMEELLAELQHHHGEVAKRIVGTIVLDETHLSEDQLLAKARDCYAKDT